MTDGRGRFDNLCAEALEKSKGEAAVLIVVEGAKGSSLSIRESYSLAGGKYHMRRLPALLRHVAKELEEEIERDGNAFENTD